jgi:hypothetical protein
LTTLFLVDELTVSVTEREDAEACGSAGALAVIDTDVMLVGDFETFSRD